MSNAKIINKKDNNEDIDPIDDDFDDDDDDFSQSDVWSSLIRSKKLKKLLFA